MPKQDPIAPTKAIARRKRGIEHEAPHKQYLARTGESGQGSSKRFRYSSDDPESKHKALEAAKAFLAGDIVE